MKTKLLILVLVVLMLGSSGCLPFQKDHDQAPGKTSLRQERSDWR